MKTRRISLIFLIFSFVICGLVCQVLADGPAVLWQKTFGGSDFDEGFSVQQTSDGGYIIAGYTQSFGTGDEDVYLIKTDSAGNSLWQKNFGGFSYDFGQSVQQTSEGGYIVAGYTDSFGAGDYDVYLIKTDSTGKCLWQRTFGGSGDEYGQSVQQTSDGGYIIAGYTDSFGAGLYDFYLIKTDPNGEGQWEKTFGGSDEDYGFSVQETPDSGFIISGATFSYGLGFDDVYLIKTDPNGESQWQKIFGGSDYDWGQSIQQAPEGGFIIAGGTFSFGKGSADVYLIKTEPNGNKIWQKTYGGSGYERGLSVHKTSDGGYIIAGYTGSFGAGLYDVYLIKTDSSGNEIWHKTLGGSYWDEGYSVQETIDGGYIVVGYTESFGAGWYDVYLIRLCSEDVLLGDLNCDDLVDFEDFVLLANQWLQEPAIPSADIAPEIRDNFVDFLDLATFVGYWLEETGS